MSVNSRLKATKIIGQRKAFYRQRIPDFSCARKETVDIYILVTSRNGHRKIMLPDDAICNIASYADDTTLYSKYDQASDLCSALHGENPN